MTQGGGTLLVGDWLHLVWSVNHCFNENQRVKEWTDGWMDEGMDGWVSSFFVELLLHWAASSLGYLVSQLLLLWAASYQGTSSLTLLWAASQLALLQLLQPNSSLRAAVTICFRNLQLQSRKAGEWQHYRCFLARSCQCVCHNRLSQPVANPHSRRVAPNRPIFAQRWMSQRCSKHARCLRYVFFFCEIELSLQSRAHFANVYNLLMNLWQHSKHSNRTSTSPVVESYLQPTKL